MEKEAAKIADDLPPCKRGCDKNLVVVVLVKDSVREGYIIQCMSCQNGTPIMDLTAAIDSWKKDFAKPQSQLPI